jgi:hypothetical protein
VRRRRHALPIVSCLTLVLALAACGGSGSDAGSSSDTKAKTPNAHPEAQPLAGRPKEGAKVGEHWHAAFGLDLCGEWLTAPAFEDEAGIHSHGDGLVHDHPFTTESAGRNATMEKFFTGGGWKVTATSFDFGPDAKKANGDPCPDGKPGVVRWAVNGKEQHGNLSDFIPFDGDVIALAFLPADAPIPTPPQEKALEQISDLAG